jgi:hypothetical protein
VHVSYLNSFHLLCESFVCTLDEVLESAQKSAHALEQILLLTTLRFDVIRADSACEETNVCNDMGDAIR